MIVSWLVIRGKTHWQWLNLLFAFLMILMVVFVFLAGESPIRAYKSEPFAFLMSHLLILSLSLSVFLVQIIAVPALLKRTADRHDPTGFSLNIS